MQLLVGCLPHRQVDTDTTPSYCIYPIPLPPPWYMCLLLSDTTAADLRQTLRGRQVQLVPVGYALAPVLYHSIIALGLAMAPHATSTSVGIEQPRVGTRPSETR